MSEQKVDILLVEDDNDHVFLVQRAFRDHLDRFTLTVASDLKDARAHLAAQSPNLIITDLCLPDGQGIELLPSEQKDCLVPVVVMTGHGDERLAVEAMKAGALDYIVKSHETMLDMPHIAKRVLSHWHYLTEHKRMQDDLQVRLRYEEALAACSQGLLTDVEIEEPLVEVLRRLLWISDVGRVCIFENFEDADGGLCTRLRNEVCASGVTAQIDNPARQHLSYDSGLGRWRKELSQGKSICGPVQSFPERERKILESRDIVSILILPIWTGDKWYGFICFDDIQKQCPWPEQKVRLLHTAAKMIGAYIERKESKKNLLEYQRRLQSLVCQLTMAEAQERKRIAGILHDDVIQNLIFLKMKLADLRSLTEQEVFRETLARINTLTDDLLKNMRTLTFDLSSPILYELGLGPAIDEWLSRELEQKHGISTEFEDDEQTKQLTEDLRVLLFRAVRELLTNIVKHARAKNIKVSIHRNEKNIVITVKDDGIGFTVPQDGFKYDMKGGSGLFTTRERIERYNGGMEIESKPGEGTRIVLTAPLALK